MPARLSRFAAGVLTLLLSSIGLVSSAPAGFIPKIEPNNSIAAAQSVDAAMTSESVSFIEDSTLLPHATVIGIGNGSLDYYSFTVNSPGNEGIFDVDLAGFTFDAVLFLFSPTGALITMNDTMAGPADTFSTSTDPFLRHTFTEAGVHTIGIAQAGATAADGGIIGQGAPLGRLYLLNISVEDTAVPEPGTLLLLGTGLTGLAWRQRRRRAAARRAATTSGG